MRDRYKIISKREENGRVVHSYRGRVHYGSDIIGYAPNSDDYIVIEIRKCHEKLLGMGFINKIVTNIKGDN